VHWTACIPLYIHTKLTSVPASQVAYVAQSSWILNMSLKQNVTIAGQRTSRASETAGLGQTKHDEEGGGGGYEVDEARYAEALRVSGLEEDLASLPAGDATEIGERGINISGGQKQRVSLARLVYSHAPICLMDDPLSALDATMSNHVLEQCVHGLLERQGRTRLMVTNKLEPGVLGRADAVMWLDQGRVRFFGPLSHLMADGNTVTDGSTAGDFAQFLAATQQQEEELEGAPATPPAGRHALAAVRHESGKVGKGDKRAPAASLTVENVDVGGLVVQEDRETGVRYQHSYNNHIFCMGSL
jgi:ATP-binding cassette subfamily C (CFTR/MRP) protein 1